jgi:translation initiation factor IF-1
MRDILFHVCLDHNNEIVLGYLSGNMRRNHIQVVLGDKVLIELPESNCKKGRIVYRLTRRRVPSPNQQTFMEQLEDDQQVKEPSESSKDTETQNQRSSNSLQPSDQEEKKKEKRRRRSKQSSD